jgi:FtsH-binding integral membrane protein
MQLCCQGTGKPGCNYSSRDDSRYCIILYLAIVVSLSLYAIFTPTDFSVKWGIVIVILMSMLMLGIFSIFFPFLNNLYCCLGVILVGIYLIIDTQLIIGGRRFELSLDDYVVGALLLYVDIIQIFLYILEMLSNK